MSVRVFAPTVVEQEKARKSKQPYFEGLPSNLELLEKMGECVIIWDIWPQ